MRLTQLARQSWTEHDWQLERWARLGRRLARQACPGLRPTDSIPVEVVPGDEPPHVVGEGYQWISKLTGKPVRGPGGHARYVYSSRCVVVGYEWLALRLAAEIDRE